MEETQNSKVGLYGKIPGHGDFVSRNLEDEFMVPWDQWLQNVISVSREQLENLWLQTFLTSPIWRFSFEGGACGAYPMTGVMIPSVDKVGRYFPFVLAAPITNSPLHHLINDEEWYNHAEDILLATLESDIKVDQVLEMTAAMPELSSAKLTESNAIQVHHSFDTPKHAKMVWGASTAEFDSVKDALPGFFEVALNEFFSPYSLWWTNGSEQIDRSLLVCDGMPPLAGFAAMLDGNWDQWGWPRHQLIKY
ncbi:MAG: type VI secretion system-associated protein TagF [Gammaproteobacteria bacterium]|nr:MAG: type VI secretion system-associated protein TagF [Gammaproteobacteria bacterium]